jgi:hypothetical protein
MLKVNFAFVFAKTILKMVFLLIFLHNKPTTPHQKDSSNLPTQQTTRRPGNPPTKQHPKNHKQQTKEWMLTPQTLPKQQPLLLDCHDSSAATDNLAAPQE